MRLGNDSKAYSAPIPVCTAHTTVPVRILCHTDLKGGRARGEASDTKANADETLLAGPPLTSSQARDWYLFKAQRLGALALYHSILVTDLHN